MGMDKFELTERLLGQPIRISEVIKQFGDGQWIFSPTPKGLMQKEMQKEGLDEMIHQLKEIPDTEMPAVELAMKMSPIIRNAKVTGMLEWEAINSDVQGSIIFEITSNFVKNNRSEIFSLLSPFLGQEIVDAGEENANEHEIQSRLDDIILSELTERIANILNTSEI